MITSNLAAAITDDAVNALARQRDGLNRFIKEQLKDSVDYGKIPGTPKPTLLQPGAQKLANIFQLGSRIIKSDTQIDHERKFVMCTYQIELYHLPSGKVIAQCEGSTNSLEKKYAKQDPYGLVNTLQKMAQKRAFIGAVVQATNASDFFTQDIEDMELRGGGYGNSPKFQKSSNGTTTQTNGNTNSDDDKLDKKIHESITQYAPDWEGLTWRQATQKDPVVMIDKAERLIAGQNKKAPSRFKTENIELYTIVKEYALELASKGENVEDEVVDEIPF